MGNEGGFQWGVGMQAGGGGGGGGVGAAVVIPAPFATVKGAMMSYVSTI